MAVSPLPALLAVLTVLFFSCTVIGRISKNNNHRKMIHQDSYTMSRKICASSGFTKSQMNICRREPDTTFLALEGLKVAVKECQFQFLNDRWNCSSLSTRSENPYTSTIYQRGFRETAFAYALSSASVVIAVARACSQGSLRNCGCDNSNRNKISATSTEKWKWLGCHDNLPYGLKFSRRFLDVREEGQDLPSSINLHNNKVGRLEVKANMEMKCRCHGLSGSCEQKTCWRTVPNLRKIAERLKKKYKSAFLVQSNNVRPVDKKIKKKSVNVGPRKELRLRYNEKSPNFCEKNDSLGIPGTSGRHCNTNSSASSPDSCSIICCGRGHDQIKERSVVQCNCTFTWCCKVNCMSCSVEKYISICK